MINIKQRVDENRFNIEELSPLFNRDPALSHNRLQIFINNVVKYAENKKKLLDSDSVSASVSSYQDEQTSQSSYLTGKTKERIQTKVKEVQKNLQIRKERKVS